MSQSPSKDPDVHSESEGDPATDGGSAKGPPESRDEQNAVRDIILRRRAHFVAAALAAGVTASACGETAPRACLSFAAGSGGMINAGGIDGFGAAFPCLSLPMGGSSGGGVPVGGSAGAQPCLGMPFGGSAGGGGTSGVEGTSGTSGAAGSAGTSGEGGASGQGGESGTAGHGGAGDGGAGDAGDGGTAGDGA